MSRKIIKVLKPFADLLEYPDEFVDAGGMFYVEKADIVAAQRMIDELLKKRKKNRAAR